MKEGKLYSVEQNGNPCILTVSILCFWFLSYLLHNFLMISLTFILFTVPWCTAGPARLFTHRNRTSSLTVASEGFIHISYSILDSFLTILLVTSMKLNPMLEKMNSDILPEPGNFLTIFLKRLSELYS